MRTTTQMKIGMTFPAHLAVFDVESTGVDVETDRIVTAFIGLVDTATMELVDSWEWLIDPGIEIPAEATAVHGITTEKARLYGADARRSVQEIATRLEILAKESYCIVVMNAPYDFTILDRELLRHHPRMRPLMEPSKDDGKIHWPVVFDPMVYDRAIDKWRKGSRRLVDLCQFYGVPVSPNAHDAKADCIMAAGVAVKLLGHSRVQALSLSEVHDKLIPTKKRQATELREYWQKKATDNRTPPEERADLRRRIEEITKSGGQWPMIQRPTTPKKNGASE